MTEYHRLCVPDEEAAIEAAQAWLSGAPPAARPYESLADMSGYVIGNIAGQCEAKNGKISVLLYVSAHVADHRMHWHSFEQELWGLLLVNRKRNKQLGRIPDVNHTDRANLARLESLDLSRIDPKHVRWFAEIAQGGGILVYRPGLSALHKGRNGLSRNVEGRDRFILTKSQEYKYWRERIKGIQTVVRDGTAEDEGQEALTVDKVPQEELEPLPHAQGLAVSQKYERKAQENKFGGAARGDKRAALTPAEAVCTGSQQEASRFAASQPPGPEAHKSSEREPSSKAKAKAKAKAGTKAVTIADYKACPQLGLSSLSSNLVYQCLGLPGKPQTYHFLV